MKSSDELQQAIVGLSALWRTAGVMALEDPESQVAVTALQIQTALITLHWALGIRPAMVRQQADTLAEDCKPYLPQQEGIEQALDSHLDELVLQFTSFTETLDQAQELAKQVMPVLELKERGLLG